MKRISLWKQSGILFLRTAIFIFAYRYIYWRINIIYHGLYYDIISEDKMFFD